MHKITKSFLMVVPVAMMFAGCAPVPQKTAAEHQQELGSTQEDKLTLGTFQASIREGMSQGDVAAAVGSPNIVTQDADGNDTWIYDKISTVSSYSDTSQSQSTSIGGGAIGIFGNVLGGIGLGAIGGGASQGSSGGAGASSQTQKTLTVVIKFDENHLVSKIRYQSSSF